MCWDENNCDMTHYKWHQVFLAVMQNIAVTGKSWCEDFKHQQCMDWATSSCTAQLYLGALLRSAVIEDAGSASEQQQSPWIGFCDHGVLFPWAAAEKQLLLPFLQPGFPTAITAVSLWAEVQLGRPCWLKQTENSNFHLGLLLSSRSAWEQIRYVVEQDSC